MRTDTLDEFLQSLAARVPAPGGGASAALHAAQAAALVGMVARYSDGETYAGHVDTITAVRDDSDECRLLALSLAEQDAAVFGAVGSAFAMPRATEREKTGRSLAIAAALIEAGRVPAQVVALADRILGLAERLRPIGNPTVVSDVAAAADAARAAASTARVNVEINLVGITDPGARAELADALTGVDDLLVRADKVTAAVREQIVR
ncbi:cyclodeaminase/cyclohydrolase family protein [Pseudonocardia lutea]|jgi:formiminotetrahydrofolate cyclodeaminase|uniref:Cyclodeaminase/cyclohydrolase family protein n=1 Tax=Pseudonocardia lutea TaxID=2172015 RepID=A0ABW1II68_9PSEU